MAGFYFTQRLPTARPITIYKAANLAEQLDQARALLNIHGFLSDAEERAIARRIKRWWAAPGVKRARRSRQGGG